MVLNSSFCVLKVIPELQRRGANYGAVNKKHWYYPKNIPGDAIVLQLRSNTVGDVDSLQGTFNNFPFCVYCQQEIEYTTMTMRKESSLTQMDDHPTTSKFKVLGVLLIVLISSNNSVTYGQKCGRRCSRAY